MIRPLLLVPVLALIALGGCNRPHDSAFYNRGGPESRLDVSSEVVNLSVAGPGERAQLASWIEQDRPSRAELYCTAGDSRCTEARKVLELQGVPVMDVSSMDFTVTLVYERILARDCNQRFRDNSRNNNYNAPHPALGCAISANIVQHVPDKQQFVEPNLMDTPRATGAVTAYERAYTPRPPSQQSTGVDQSIVNSARSQGQ